MSTILHFLDGAIVNSDLYFSSADFNGLYKWDLANRKSEFLGHFPCEDIFMHNIYGHVISHRNKLFFLPIHGKAISIYDTHNFSFSSIRLAFSNAGNNHISSYVPYREGYLLIPGDLKKEFLYLSPEDNVITTMSDIADGFKEVVKNEDSALCRYGGATLHKGKLLVAVVDKNYFIETDLHGVFRKNVVEGFKVNNIYSDGESLWLVSSDGKAVMKWNGENDYQIIRLENVIENAFFSFAQYRSTVLLLPWKGSEVLIYDKENNEWKTFFKVNCLDDKECNVKGTGAKYCDWAKWNSWYFLFPSAGTDVVQIDSNSSVTEMFQIIADVDFQELEQTNKKHIFRAKVNSGEMLYETEELELKRLIEFLVEEDN